MRDCYIPDLTERYPEGFGGIDMWEPRDPEYEFWCAVEEAERQEVEELEESNEDTEEFWEAVEDIVQKGEDIVEEEPKQSFWEELIAIMNSEE